MANKVVLRAVIGVLQAMGLAFAGPALAACDVTMSTILPSYKAVLYADCGRSDVRQITLTRDMGLPSAVTLGQFTFSPATSANIKLATPLISGTHMYTATAWDDATGSAVVAGKAVVIIHCAVAGGVADHPSC